MSEQAALPALPVAGAGASVVNRNPFTVSNYRRWWAASVVGGMGVGIQAVTVPLFVRDRVSDDNRGLAIAFALICTTAPGAVLALLGGVIADRVERRRILVRTYTVAALVSLAYVVLSGIGRAGRLAGVHPGSDRRVGGRVHESSAPIDDAPDARAAADPERRDLGNYGVHGVAAGVRADGRRGGRGPVDVDAGVRG
jgi:hypothetical protein